jgi:hypothetical protein
MKGFCKKRAKKVSSFALSSLMPRAGQKLLVFVLPHLLSTLLDNASQSITPFPHCLCAFIHKNGFLSSF